MFKNNEKHIYIFGEKGIVKYLQNAKEGTFAHVLWKTEKDNTLKITSSVIRIRGKKGERVLTSKKGDLYVRFTITNIENHKHSTQVNYFVDGHIASKEQYEQYVQAKPVTEWMSKHIKDIIAIKVRIAKK